jgi:sensor domain CHASE-containing protein
MGNLIPWSQIDPSIKSEQPFVGVIMVDPQGKLCVSELVHLDPETMGNAEQVASEIIAAAQQAAARVAGSYRAQRKPPPVRSFRVLKGGAP